MFLGYIAWLFRRVARREANRDGRTFIDVEYADNVTRQREEYNPRWEWAGKKLLSPVPYTIMESTNRTLHVSYIWLLRAEENRKEELPSFVRPYSGDIANPEGHEAKGPRAFDPYLNAFNVGTYKNDICQGKTTLGITARWMKGFIRYDYPSQEEIDEIHVEIKNIDRELEQGLDRRLINELKERKIQLERFVSPLEERRNELLKVFDRDRALRALDNQINWGE